MPVPKELLEILACPICRVEVKITADESGLKCVKCGRIYPVRDDIPIMLVDEAILAPTEDIPEVIHDTSVANTTRNL